MSNKKIDLDRGVTHRNHPSGFQVFMYKDEPGVFRSVFGKEVAPDVASAAGFPVAELLKERKRRDRIADVTRKVNEEFDAPVEEKIVYERGDFKAVQVGKERYDAKDEDGNILNQRPLTKKEAISVVDQLAGAAEREAKAGTA